MQCPVCCILDGGNWFDIVNHWATLIASENKLWLRKVSSLEDLCKVYKYKHKYKSLHILHLRLRLQLFLNSDDKGYLHILRIDSSCLLRRFKAQFSALNVWCPIQSESPQAFHFCQGFRTQMYAAMDWNLHRLYGLQIEWTEQSQTCG